MITRYTIVVDQDDDWKWSREGFDLMTVSEYLERGAIAARHRGAGRVINLCRAYHYLSGGYYCSLLAEARREIPLPTMADILDLSHKSLYEFVLPELDSTLRTIPLTPEDTQRRTLRLPVFFGQAAEPAFSTMARRLFDVFRYPLMRVTLAPRNGQWRIQSLGTLGLHQVTKAQRAFFEQCLLGFTRANPRRRPDRLPPLYDLAILYDPKEKFAPSDPQALAKFVKVGQSLRMHVEMIVAKDFHRIAEFDALFLRETTATNHHTFRFARKAEQEGLPVIDDTGSIIRCANKVFLHEILSSHQVPVPRSMVLDRIGFCQEDVESVESRLGYPVILKVPDGSFSRGVLRADDREGLMTQSSKLFAQSRLILAQEYMYTPFDWRIGILAGKPLFASQYMMSRNHWQIYRHAADGSVQHGGFRSVPVDAAPPEVVETARRAANLVGNGLYGVDLKQTPRGVFAIEVNDNPNLDQGVEDKVLKDELYAILLREFISRIEAPTGR
ncbi:MAG: RimK family protein [Magnetococcus sp. WYHC-3]